MDTTNVTDDQKGSAFMDRNRVYVLGEFDNSLRGAVIVPLTKKIEELERIKDARLDIYINSNGGSSDVLWHLVGLLELAQRKGIIVRTIVMARAYSAGSMLAIVGTKGERYIDHHAEHLPHFGTFYGYGNHTPLQLERETAFYKRRNKQLVEHYKQYAKIPRLEERIKDDKFFIPADKCVLWGLADKYIEEL